MLVYVRSDIKRSCRESFHRENLLLRGFGRSFERAPGLLAADPRDDLLCDASADQVAGGPAKIVELFPE